MKKRELAGKKAVFNPLLATPVPDIDPDAIKQLPNTDALDEHKYHSKWLHDLGEDILENIDMVDITRIQKQLSTAAWLDGFKNKLCIVKQPNYYRTILILNDMRQTQDTLVK